MAANIWKKGEQVSTLEQIRYIVNHATKNRAILLTDPEALMRLEESYWSPSSPHRPHSTLKLPKYSNNSASSV